MKHRYITKSYLCSFLGAIFIIFGFTTIGFSTHLIMSVWGAFFLIAGLFLVYKSLKPNLYEGYLDQDRLSWKLNGQLISDFSKNEIQSIEIYESKLSEKIVINLKNGQQANIEEPQLFFGSLSELLSSFDNYGYKLIKK